VEPVLLEDPDAARVPDQGVGLDVPLEDVRLELQVAVVGTKPAGDRLGVLGAVTDGRLLQSEQVELGEVIGFLD